MIGKNIPIPFSETKVSPDNVCDRYINIPNKKRFINMFNRPKTNCNWRFLNKNIVTKDSKAEIKNNTGTIVSIIEAPESKSTINIGVLFCEFVQILKIEVRPAEIITAINK